MRWSRWQLFEGAMVLLGVIWLLLGHGLHSPGLAMWFASREQLWEKRKSLHEDRDATRARVLSSLSKAGSVQRRMVQALADAVAKTPLPSR